MTDTPTITPIVANCSSTLSIEREGNVLTVALKLEGLPDLLIQRLIDVGNEMTVPMLGAIMKAAAGEEGSSRLFKIPAEHDGALH